MTLHRAQILLEPWQHARLKDLARDRRTTISRLVREMIERGLEEELGPPRRILGLAGIVSDGDWVEADIDRTVYHQDR